MPRYPILTYDKAKGGIAGWMQGLKLPYHLRDEPFQPNLFWPGLSWKTGWNRAEKMKNWEEFREKSPGERKWSESIMPRETKKMRGEQLQREELEDRRRRAKEHDEGWDEHRRTHWSQAPYRWWQRWKMANRGSEGPGMDFPTSKRTQAQAPMTLAQSGIAGLPIVRAQSLGAYGQYAGGIGVTGATGGPVGYTSGFGGGGGGPMGGPAAVAEAEADFAPPPPAPVPPEPPSPLPETLYGDRTFTKGPPIGPFGKRLAEGLLNFSESYGENVGLKAGIVGNLLGELGPKTYGEALLNTEGYYGAGQPGGQLIDTRYRDYPQGNFPENEEDGVETNPEESLMPIVTAQHGLPTIRAQGGLGLGSILFQLSPEFRELFESQRGSGETFDPTQPTLVNRGFVAPPSDYQHGIMDQWNYYPESGQGTIAEIPRVDPATGAGVATSPADADLLASAGIPNLAAKHGYNPAMPTVRAQGGLYPDLKYFGNPMGGPWQMSDTMLAPVFNQVPQMRQLYERIHGGAGAEDRATLVNREYAAPPEDYQHGIDPQWNYYPESGEGTTKEVATVKSRHGYNPSLPTVRMQGSLWTGSGYPGSKPPPSGMTWVPGMGAMGGPKLMTIEEAGGAYTTAGGVGAGPGFIPKDELSSDGGTPAVDPDPAQTLSLGTYTAPPEDYQHGIDPQWNYYPESGATTMDPETVTARYGYNPSLPTVRKFMGGLFEGSGTAYPEDGGSAPSGGGNWQLGHGLPPEMMEILRRHAQGEDPMGEIANAQQFPEPLQFIRGGRPTATAVPMNTGGMVQDAMRLQAAGTGPHNQLVHMTQGEVDAMNSLAGSGIGGLRSNGMAINPQTGLPEAGVFSSILPALAGIGLTIASGGTAAPWALGLASGAGSLVGQKLEGEEVDVGKMFLAGLGGWGAGELGTIFGGAGEAAAAQAGTEAATQVGTEAAATTLANVAPTIPGSAFSPFGNQIMSTPANLANVGANIGSNIPTGFIPQHLQSNIVGQNLTGTTLGAGLQTPVEPFQSLITQATGPDAATQLSQTAADKLAEQYGVAATKDAAMREAGVAAWRADPNIGKAIQGAGQWDPTSWASSPGTVGLKETLAPGAALAASTADAFGAFDYPEYKYPEDPLDTYDYQGPYLPRPRTAFAPPADYQPGIDPAYQYYSYGNKGGYVGGLPTIRAQTGYERPLKPTSPAMNILTAIGAEKTGLGATAQPGRGAPRRPDFSMLPGTAFRNQLAQAQARPQQVAPVSRQDPLLTTGLAGLTGQRQPTLPGQMPGQQIFARHGGYANDLPTVRMEGGADSLEPPPGTKWQGLRDYMHPDRPRHPRETRFGGWAPRPPRQDRGTDYEDMKRSVLRDMLTSRSARDLQKLGPSVTGPEQVPMYHPDYGYRVYNRPESEGGVPEQRWKYAWNKKQYGGIAGLPTVRMQGEFEGTTDQRRARFASDKKLELAEDARKNKEALERADLSKLSDSELAELLAASDLSSIYGFAPRTDIGARKLNREYSKRIYDNPDKERLRYAAYREGLHQLQQQGSSPSPFPKDYRPATEEQVREYKTLYESNYPGIPEIAVPYAPPVDPTVPPHLQGKAGTGEVKKQVGGVAGEPVDIATSGLMGGAAPEIQAAVAERDMVMPAPDQPQNAEERAVFDQALLALQGELEPEPAQAAITEFIDTFGPEAFRQLQALVSGERENGGLVQPANGETTVGMTEEEAMAQQGPDVIPGKIVDPTTGKQTANLLVGENEYIEPADSLSRRAMAAGMAGTPQNGAIVRGREEEQLRRAYG